MADNKGWIGFDLDGTLAHYDGWRGPLHIGRPIPAMIERLKQHIAAGDDCRIFTARIEGFGKDTLDADGMAVRAIWHWLKEQGLPLLTVTCRKDFNMVKCYDDRAVQVETNTGQLVEERLESAIAQLRREDI
jgi:hypothetical protein